MDYEKAKITAIPEVKKQKKAEQIIKMVKTSNLNDISNYLILILKHP